MGGKDMNKATRGLMRYMLGAFYIAAGVNHFINPAFYLPLIPPYFPHPEVINIVAGVVEIVLGLMVFWDRTVWWGCMAIIAMLIAFIPSHVYFVQIGSCIDGGLCVPPWVGWVRLIVIHPILLFWAWSVGRIFRQ
jgi:uncharacterized membrane protein